MLAVALADSLCAGWVDKLPSIGTYSLSALLAVPLAAFLAGVEAVRMPFLQGSSCTFAGGKFFSSGFQSRHAQGTKPAKNNPSLLVTDSQVTAYCAAPC